MVDEVVRNTLLLLSHLQSNPMLLLHRPCKRPFLPLCCFVASFWVHFQSTLLLMLLTPWCNPLLYQQKNQASFFRREPKRQNQRNQMSTKERDKNAERQNTFHCQKKQGSLLRERQEYKKTRTNNRRT